MSTFPRAGYTRLRTPREATGAICSAPGLERSSVSGQGVGEHPRDYAIVWRTGDGPTSSGRLELGDEELVLHGSGEPEELRFGWTSSRPSRSGVEPMNGSTATSRSSSSGPPASACSSPLSPLWGAPAW